VLINANGLAQTTNTFPASGNVGIGTTSPTDYLAINGTNINKVGIGLINSSGTPTGLSILTGGSSGFGIPNWANASVIEGESPNGLVLGSVNAPGNNIGGPITFQIARLPVAVISTAGYLGIGTSTPGATLTVAGTIAGRTANGYPTTGAGYYALTTNNTDANNGGLTLQYLYAGILTNGLSLIQNGNVGIGTTAPGAKLEVDGNLKLTAGSGASITFQDGTTQSTAWTGVLCGGDYAESVDVTGDRKHYEPGDVLVLDSNANGNVAKSSEPYSTMVAGIYATKPGVIGRRQSLADSTGDIPMAMVGIVPTKVAAENGPIRQGDLLVTSSQPGYAMKGTDRSRMLGAVLGKAMGSLDAGTGTIEVLVTLQ
jgi:hypothetical protein